jgi:hypothetical protein
VWFTEEAIAAWRAEPRTTRGGQPHYSALAISNVIELRGREQGVVEGVTRYVP